jgi:cyclopropane-fatty-acyl-phospholipid synthase
MEICRRSLAPRGLLLLHTIGARGSGLLQSADPWLSTRIFGNGELPGPRQIVDCAEGLFTIEDWHNVGADYDRTLMAWHERFGAARGALRERYDERFFRLWNYYLLCCAGLFRARGTQLWQVVLSRNGLVGGYRAPR